MTKIQDKYISSIPDLNEDLRSFIISQIGRLPDYYLFGVKIICFFLYVFKLNPSSLALFNKLFMSLKFVKKYET